MTKEFKESLQNFAFDAAAGRAIRHLCDAGLSVEEIHEQLDFPVPMERLRSEIQKYEAEKAAVENGETERYRIVKEYGKYGKTTFRKVKEKRCIVANGCILSQKKLK